PHPERRGDPVRTGDQDPEELYALRRPHGGPVREGRGAGGEPADPNGPGGHSRTAPCKAWRGALGVRRRWGSPRSPRGVPPPRGEPHRGHRRLPPWRVPEPRVDALQAGHVDPPETLEGVDDRGGGPRRVSSGTCAAPKGANHGSRGRRRAGNGASTRTGACSRYREARKGESESGRRPDAANSPKRRPTSGHSLNPWPLN